MVDGVGASGKVFFCWLVGKVAIYYFSELLTAFDARGAPLGSKVPSNSPPNTNQYLTTHWLFGTDYFYMTPLSAALSPGRSLFCSKDKTRLEVFVSRGVGK